MRRMITVVALFVVTGCAMQPVISDISDSSLKVQTNPQTPVEAADAKAVEGCGLYGKKPTYISTQGPDYYTGLMYRLYACN